MPDLMAVLLDGIAQLEYHRDRPLEPRQAGYLDAMDRKMDSVGIDLDGQRIRRPDLGQKAQFVATGLADAITGNDEARAAALCTWLATRLPDLKQVKLRRAEAGFAIELDFAAPYVRQFPLQFTPRRRAG